MRAGQRTENLRKDHSINNMGYKSILESRPQVTTAFLSLWQKGYSYRKSREELLTQFPAEDVPSINALNNYIRNHLQDTEQGRKVYYSKLIRQFDSVSKAYSIALESQKLYQIAASGNAGMSAKIKALKQFGDANFALFKLEMEMGLRSPINSEPESPKADDVGEFKEADTAEEHHYRMKNDKVYCRGYSKKVAAEAEEFMSLTPLERYTDIQNRLKEAGYSS